MATRKKVPRRKRPVRRRATGRRLTLLRVKNELVREFPTTILEFQIRDKGRTKVLGMDIPREHLVPISRFLQQIGFEHCSLISAVDWKDRFDIVYHISSFKHNLLVQITVQLPRDDPRVDSISKIWGGANWHEREAWDLMGIEFINHPNLKRILLPEDFEGHPLRKDWKGGS